MKCYTLSAVVRCYTLSLCFTPFTELLLRLLKAKFKRLLLVEQGEGRDPSEVIPGYLPGRQPSEKHIIIVDDWFCRTILLSVEILTCFGRYLHGRHCFLFVVQQADKEACVIVDGKRLGKEKRSHQKLTNTIQSLIHVGPMHTQCAAPQFKEQQTSYQVSSLFRVEDSLILE